MSDVLTTAPIPSLAKAPTALALSGTPWADGVARAAGAATLARGLPDRRVEDWKYTNLGFLREAKLAFAPAPLAAENMRIATVERRTEGAGADIVLYNGWFVAGLSRVSAPGVRVRAVSIERASTLAAIESGFASEFGADRFASGSWFDALGAACAQDAVLIEVDPGVRVAAPIVVTCLTSGSAAAGGAWTASFPRVFVRFGRQSEGVVLDRHVSMGDGPAVAAPAFDVVVEEGARASCVRVQAEGAENRHFGSLRATVQRDARFESLQVQLGALLGRQDLTVRLVGQGAETVVNGLYVTEGKQHVDSRTSIEHVVADTQSSQLYKGILSDESRAVFSGRIRIERDAQRSNAAQLCQNLSLSKKAEVDAKPELEIFADDVKASHGATVSQMDPEQLFYFQTRAIDRASAAAALAEGFAQDVILRLGSPEAAEFVRGDAGPKFHRVAARAKVARAGGAT